MSQPLILLIEDNLADVVFFQEALRATGLKARIEVAKSGEEALRFLRRQGRHAQAPRPDVIVLDLNLPVKNGHQVAAELAEDMELGAIPVAVLTTSSSETCVCRLFPQGRCLYFVKTDEFKRLQEIVRKIVVHAGPATAQAPRL